MADPKKNSPTTTTPEERRANFVRLAEKRTGAAIAAINNVGKLARPAAYSYGAGDRDKILEALRAAVQACEDAFRTGGAGAPAFKL